MGQEKHLVNCRGQGPLSGIAPRVSPPVLRFLFSLRGALSSPSGQDTLPGWAFPPGQLVSPAPWHLPSVQPR